MSPNKYDAAIKEIAALEEYDKRKRAAANKIIVSFSESISGDDLEKVSELMWAVANVYFNHTSVEVDYDILREGYDSPLL